MTVWEPMPAVQVDEILSAIAEPLLFAGGFRSVARRRWVRSHPPVRHVFELVAMKGATLCPRWGLSLDFVPHLKGKSLAWHRTEKSALLDLVHDPVDFDAHWAAHWAIETSRGPEGMSRDAERVIPVAVQRARSWLDDAVDVASALERAEWLRTAERPGRRFGFDDWVQQPLALAILLGRAGRLDEARAQLEGWTSRSNVGHHREALLALLEGVSA